jgi:hypothetical protein
MSTDRDVTRIVRSWLKEDAHEDANRVLDRVFEQLDATPQRRARWLARRFPAMNNGIRILIAAAAVAAVALVGIRLTSSGTSGGPVATPNATEISTTFATSSPRPSPALRRLPGSGALLPGRYTIDVPGSPLTVAVTIGEGWTSGDWYLMDPPDFRKQVSFWTVANVYRDVCDGPGGIATASALPEPAIGPTVDDLVSALDAQSNTETSPAVDVTVGGSRGKRLTISEAFGPACAGDAGRPMWVDPSGAPARQIGREQTDGIWIVDANGQRLVIDTSADPQDVDATTTVAAVIDSIEFVGR